MIISHSNKFIYFKAQKVAGTSTQRFFEQFCDKNNDIIGWRGKEINRPKDVIWFNHKCPSKIKETLNDQNVWDNYFKFGNIRNPWDRVVSSYFYKKDTRHNIPHDISFEDFIKQKKQGKLKSLYEWFCIDELQVDYKSNMYFIRFENLQEDISKICDILNLKPKEKLKHENKSNRNTDYKTYYNKETKQIVEEIYQDDIRFFNYTY